MSLVPPFTPGLLSKSLPGFFHNIRGEERRRGELQLASDIELRSSGPIAAHSREGPREGRQQASKEWEAGGKLPGKLWEGGRQVVQ